VRGAAASLPAVFDALYRLHGRQHWWPGDSPFEVMVGAVLTQNTAWTNVERAIANLSGADLLDPQRLLAVAEGELAAHLRPAGYFNVKARRLRNLCRWYVEGGAHSRLARLPTEELRRGLLSVNGVGPETADDILLYAFERPVFVIDAYTRRIFARLGHAPARAGYEEFRRYVEDGLARDVASPRRPAHVRTPRGLYNEFHALIVAHGKGVCRTRPLCGRCPLAGKCLHARTDSEPAPTRRGGLRPGGPESAA
jgi:endonuclease-3 related protein